MYARVAAVLLVVAALSGLGPSPAMGRAAEPHGCLAPGLEPFDAEMLRLLTKWEIPGGGLAVARDGRLLLARGYGVANKASGAPVLPTTKFRLGSLSKPIAAVAVLKLVEEGRLRLDEKALPLLGDLGPRPEAIRDPRVRDITVRHLLQHTGGFNRDVSGDPLFMPRAAQALARQGGQPPPTCRVVLRDALESSLDFAPGTRYAYSNLGYCILGRIVERTVGTPYQEFARTRVLAPAGATGLVLGHTLRPAAGETMYYDYPGAPLVEAMPGVARGKVPAPYGGFAVEEMDSYGGWVGAPLDYLKFFLAIDGRRGPGLLSGASFREMRARPEIRGLDPARPIFYGLGLQVRALAGGSVNWWHVGSLPGVNTLAVRTAEGYAWVAALNMRPREREAWGRELDQSLWVAARGVTRWPDKDLFDSCSD